MNLLKRYLKLMAESFTNNLSLYFYVSRQKGASILCRKFAACSQQKHNE